MFHLPFTPAGSPTPGRPRRRRLAGVLAVAVAATACAALPAAAGALTANRAPIGHLDSVVVTPGGLQVNGWAADLDTPDRTILIRVTQGAAARQPVSYMVAHNPRPDVAAVHPPLGPNHGFNYYLTTATGQFPVCVDAVDLTGRSTALGCRVVTVPADRLPIGQLDSVRSIGNGHLSITGWAIDQDVPASGVTMNIVLGAVYSYGAFNDVRILANQPRPDVAASYPAAGPNHGFALTIAAKAGSYPVCAWAFDIFQGGHARLLGCRNVTV